MNKPTPKTADELRQARMRQNYAVLGLIFGLVLLFFLITVVRIGLNS
jgi:flagellar biogenesis protein FliO